LLIIAGGLSVILRRVASISQKNVKKILGLSSIFSLGWVLVAFDFDVLIWIQFMLGYGASLLVLLGGLSLVNHRASQNFNKFFGGVNLVIFFSGFLIVRGIPPFIGFFLKMLILFGLIQKRIWFRVILLIFSLLFIFVYINIIFLLLTFLVKKFSFSTLTAENKGYFLDLLIINLGLRVIFLIRFCNLLHK
jgi:NADH:ubiquinone oxidoreductase subunit 2 (subunit N)